MLKSSQRFDPWLECPEYQFNRSTGISSPLMFLKTQFKSEANWFLVTCKVSKLIFVDSGDLSTL